MIFTIKLPSKGHIKGIPLELKVKEWDLEDIKNLSKASEVALDEVVIDVLSKNIVREGLDEKFTSSLLCQQDISFIMVSMRINVIGPEYEFIYPHSVLAPNTDKELCGHRIDIKLHLKEDIEVKEIPIDYKNHLHVELPSCLEEVRVLIPTYNYIKQSKEIFREKRSLNIDNLSVDDEDMVLFYLGLYLSGVGDKRFQSVMQALAFLERLNTQDAAAIVDIVEYFRDWGPKMVISGDCSKCKRGYQFQFPFLDTFFFDKTRFQFDVRSAIKPGKTDEHKSM